MEVSPDFCVDHFENTGTNDGTVKPGEISCYDHNNDEDDDDDDGKYKNKPIERGLEVYPGTQGVDPHEHLCQE